MALPRTTKRVVAVSFDVSACVLSLWLAYYLRLGEFVALSGNALWAVAASIAMALPIFVVLGLYRAVFRYGGLPALLAVVRAVGVYALLFSALFTAIGVDGVPRTVGLIQPLLLLILVGLSRAAARFWLGDVYHSLLVNQQQRRVLVYGAGGAGRQLVAALESSPEISVVGFLDDNPSTHGQVLLGKRVYRPLDLYDLKESLGITEVLLALPRVGRARRNEILRLMEGARVAVKTVPSLSDLLKGDQKLSSLRDLDIDDLLGRDSVSPNQALLERNVTGKKVLVTGAGGSIGSEICRQLIALSPRTILLLDQSEASLHRIHQELLDSRLTRASPVLVPLLASVRDAAVLRRIFARYEPNTVYHAAANKHVPLVEVNPEEAIRTNVFGTLAIAEVAESYGAENFVLISTDKAVRPTNLMGASKRVAEMILQALARKPSSTVFSMVRFGNVLGSSGSVVPRFRDQIRQGGPITLTHVDVTRYFMTIPEAASLVIQSGAMARGGDLFLLEMGEPVRILDLARRMVQLSGLTMKDEENIDGDIDIDIIGLRPGEKLYEELLIAHQSTELTEHSKILRANDLYLAWDELQCKLENLSTALEENDLVALIKALSSLVPEYQPSDAITRSSVV